MKSQNWGLRNSLAACIAIFLVPTVANGGAQNQTSDLQSSAVSPGPSYGQIFKENIQTAVANHPRGAAAIAFRDSYRYRQREAEAGRYPTLEVGVSGRYRMAENFENRFDNITERSRRNTSARLNITGRQLLFDAGRTAGRVASAKHAFMAAHEEYGQIVSAIALLAIESHFQVIFQRQRQKLHQEIIVDHRLTLAKVKLRFESGRGPERDVALLESRLALAEAEASLVRRTLDAAISQYEENYGFLPETLKYPDIILNIPDSLEAAFEVGFQNNPSLSIANSMMQSSKASMKAEKAERLPQVSMELAATKYDLDRGNDDYDVTGRLVMNYSLYRGGATTARISRSHKEYERARHEEADTHRRVTREIKIAYQNIRPHDSRVAALKVATDASKRNSEQLSEQFTTTGGSLLSLLEAKKDHYQVQEKYMSALIEKEIMEYRLLDAMGILNMTLNIRLNKVEK